MERLGLMGGTFDPIHCGHLLLARYVSELVGLDRVLFVPAADPPHKDHRPDMVSGAHRCAMVERALGDLDDFQTSRIELERPGKSYTVDTLRILRERHPDSQLYLIIGADNVADMSTWHDPEGILELCTVVAGSRSSPATAVTDPLLASKVTLVDTPLIDISSTHIRQRLLQGLSIRWLVPPAVEEYISSERLYQR